ncbi:MAG: hypothetical protein WC399_03370, partial [Bacilli bacterium]
LIFGTEGPHTVDFTYTEGAVTETTELTIDVLIVETPKKDYTVVIVVGSAVVISIGILLPIIIKKIRRTALRQIKKSLRKK